MLMKRGSIFSIYFLLAIFSQSTVYVCTREVREVSNERIHGMGLCNQSNFIGIGGSKILGGQGRGVGRPGGEAPRSSYILSF